MIERDASIAATDPTTLLAWFDLAGLYASVDIRSDELHDALANATYGEPVAEGARAYIHERAHLFQAVGSTIGFYAYLLQLAQTAIVGFLMHRLVHRCGVALRAPLREFARSLPTAWQEVEDLIQQWDWLEASVAELTASPDYVAAVTNPYLVPSRWSARFRYTQLAIHALYEPESQEVTADALAQEPESETEAIPEAAAFAGRLLTHEIMSVGGVMESAAYAYELDAFGEEGELAEAAGSLAYEKGAYALLIQDTKHLLGRRVRDEELLATHVALCDLALNPPVLPQHLRIRNGLRRDELSPTSRIVALWTHADVVETPKTFREIPRYEIELSRALGWTLPHEIVGAGAWHGRLKNHDPRETMYLDVLRHRQVLPMVVSDAQYLFSREPAVRRLFERVDFSIVSCRDGAIHPADPERAQLLVKYYLMHQWHRQLFLGEPERLVAPVGVPPSVVRDFCDEMSALLEAELGGHAVNGPVVYIAA